MKISVVTTLFNARETVADCLDSVAAQTYPQREHIVIDGGSGDGTLALLQQRRAQLAMLVSEPDGGIYFGLNKGIARATGEVVGLLHADDVYADTQVLVRMRVGGVSNRSVRTVLRKSWEDYRALRANGVGGVGALAWKNLSKLPQFIRR